MLCHVDLMDANLYHLTSPPQFLVLKQRPSGTVSVLCHMKSLLPFVGGKLPRPPRHAGPPGLPGTWGPSGAWAVYTTLSHCKCHHILLQTSCCNLRVFRKTCFIQKKTYSHIKCFFIPCKRIFARFSYICPTCSIEAGTVAFRRSVGTHRRKCPHMNGPFVDLRHSQRWLWTVLFPGTKGRAVWCNSTGGSEHHTPLSSGSKSKTQAIWSWQ
jgi:hypothetical protein